MTNTKSLGETRVIVGVDTHRDEHVAVAIDCLGARLGQHRLPAASRGYEGLHCWASGLGEIVAFGIEGTGSYGAGLARFLAGRGRTIIEVSQPDRSTRRRLGKSDPVDAEMAARSVFAGVARDYPKSGLDRVEMIRMLKIVKSSAIKARTQAMNQMRALAADGGVPPRNALPPSAPSRWPLSCATSRSRSRLRSCTWSVPPSGTDVSACRIVSEALLELSDSGLVPKALAISEDTVTRIWKGRIWKEGAFEGVMRKLPKAIERLRRSRE